MQAANEDETFVLSVSDEDLSLYAAGGLSPNRRRDIEGLLACNPDLAAQVMSQMHRMEHAEGGHRPGRRLMTLVAAAACCIGGSLSVMTLRGLDPGEGWREADGDTPPTYVAEAAESRQAALARARMVSQIETPSLDSREIHQVLKVRLPQLPADWRVVDAQVFPTDVGPSINVVLETNALKRLDLFAVHANTLAGQRPEIASRGRDTVAFWEDGGSAYVLSGDGKAQDLLQDAAILAKRTKL